MKKILINFLYYKSVGHVPEALKYARGYLVANKGYEISIALNKYSPTELTQATPWIKHTYPIDILEVGEKGEKAKTLKQLPRNWDYVLIDNRPMKEVGLRRDSIWPKANGKRQQNLDGLLASYAAMGKLLHSKHGIFPIWTPPPGLKYSKEAYLNFEIPRKARGFVKKKYAFSGVKICIMLGGSKNAAAYPSVRSWMKIIRALTEAYPRSRIYITGVHATYKGRTTTRAYSKEKLAPLFKRFNNVVDCYDIGLWNQLALLKYCDMFISPHAGFAFLAPCVGTPWLTISGGNWSEYFFNGVPFYSVFPDDPDFPYRNRVPHLVYKNKRWGKILPMQPERLEKKIPEIVHAAGLLLDPTFTYQKALRRHKWNIAHANVNRKRVHSGPEF